MRAPKREGASVSDAGATSFDWLSGERRLYEVVRHLARTLTRAEAALRRAATPDVEEDSDVEEDAARCTEAAKRARLLSHVLGQERAGTRVVYWRTCAGCRDLFATMHVAKTHCSPTCIKTAQQRRRRQRRREEAAP